MKAVIRNGRANRRGGRGVVWHPKIQSGHEDVQSGADHDQERARHAPVRPGDKRDAKEGRQVEEQRRGWDEISDRAEP